MPLTSPSHQPVASGEFPPQQTTNNDGHSYKNRVQRIPPRETKFEERGIANHSRKQPFLQDTLIRTLEQLSISRNSIICCALASFPGHVGWPGNEAINPCHSCCSIAAIVDILSPSATVQADTKISIRRFTT